MKSVTLKCNPFTSTDIYGNTKLHTMPILPILCVCEKLHRLYALPFDKVNRKSLRREE